MTYILFSILILWLWITGVTVMLQENMLLNFLMVWRNNLMDTWYNRVLWFVTKPLFFCPSCMSSVHGLLVTLIIADIFHLDWSLLNWVIVSVCTVPLCFFLTPKIIES